MHRIPSRLFAALTLASTFCAFAADTVVNRQADSANLNGAAQNKAVVRGIRASNANANAKGASETALDRYVAKPDPNYSFKLLNKVQAEGATVFVLEMTSQQYLTTNEVDRPIWKHWMTITK